MSTPDTQHMIRVVAEKFGLVCPGDVDDDRCPHGGMFRHPLNLLSPDGAWALEDALVARKIWVNYFDHKLVLCIGHYSNAVTVPIDGKRSLALLTAAFQITEEGRK